MQSATETVARIASDRLVVKGRATIRTLTGETVAKAIAAFEEAVRMDSTNASAHFALARAHMQSQRYLSVPKRDVQARARASLDKGRLLHPASIDGLHLLADVVLANTHDYVCAKRILEAALSLDHKDARTHHYYSQLLSGMGQFDLAFQHADTAIAYADADTRAFVLRNLGRPRYMAGQFDWVLTQYMASERNAPLAHFYRSLAYGGLGKFDEALQEAKTYLSGDPARDAGGVGMVALAYASAGQIEAARSLLRELLERDARGEHVVEYRIAAVYAVLSERDEAFRWLAKEIDDSDGLGSWLLWLNSDPVWKELRKDRRWNDIQRRAGW
ncbi:tetratricopeptide repeat protein [Gemmatimonas sp.]|uniref:tetratricopeptide repeat protein n=1 Tax=Gemmatimonas sp. TaxID=1962908 RepID=UPI003983775C